MKEVRITVEIDHEGRVTADADGFSGDACLSALDKLLEGLGLVQQNIEHKPDAGSYAARRVSSRKIGAGRK